MPVSNSRLSYSDCFTLFEKALDDSKGARYQVNGGLSRGDAWQFRLRMHNARQIDRKDNKELYEVGTKLHGRSVYDPLLIQIKPDIEGLWWIYVVHTEIDGNDIELLSEVGEATLLEYKETREIQSREPVLQITDQSIRRRV